MAEPNGSGNGRSRLEVWLPALAVVGGGLIAWGALTTRVEEMGRRVSAVEQAQIIKQRDDARVLERLSAIEANLAAVRETVGDIAAQLRGRARP